MIAACGGVIVGEGWREMDSYWKVALDGCWCVATAALFFHGVRESIALIQVMYAMDRCVDTFGPSNVKSDGC